MNEYTVVLSVGNKLPIEIAYCHIEAGSRDAAIWIAQRELAECYREFPDETLNPARHEPLPVFEGWHEDEECEPCVEWLAFDRDGAWQG